MSASPRQAGDTCALGCAGVHVGGKATIKRPASSESLKGGGVRGEEGLCVCVFVCVGALICYLDV